MGTVANIYVHIPFCRRKCPYCDFYSVEEGDTQTQQRYFRALATELPALAALGEFTTRHPPRTLYIGGGTPSLIPPSNLEPLIRALGVDNSLERDIEFSVEINPESATPEALSAWGDIGANRLSLGVQSFDDDALRVLGRIHDASTSRKALERLTARRRDHAAQLSIDLIFAIPGQTLSTWRRTLDEAVALDPDHISVYGLTYYEGTRLLAARDNGAILPADETLEAAMFEAAHETLTAAGYEHYEISNYARSGHACRHNLAVWHGDDYLGLGAAAHSRVGERRWQNPASVEEYSHALENAQTPRRMLDPPRDARARRNERLMLGLRLREGVAIGDWPEADRQAFLTEHSKFIARLTEEGLATFDGDRLSLTLRGWLVYDAIVVRFF